ncbi:hypothetical protein C8J36_102676 [Rhizobium sp. PP-F2F-G48]|uniref:hypothetical protein n=1 Tax=Rhizobium sp. PP-F2F-G48 TaxID=2135651 RepID=UPI001050752E|nr:hypothetical protein [Rhizobium sp. PP-F2F-G48]TCM57872.1 hypothetical protein C8J36_102676 [Rhizobium sp. PP-F2F-G48]
MLLVHDYENLLSSILLPPSLHATSAFELRPEGRSGWCYDEHRDLRHDYYVLRTADPEKNRKADCYVWLGDSLDFRHGWTGGVTPLSDALLIRIACVEVLKGNGTAKKVAAAQTVKILRHLEWVIRWRNSLGVRCFHDLTPEHYRRFVDDASTSDITDLLPMVDRLDVLLEDRNYQLPLYRHGRRFRMDWKAFANTLGVHRWSIGHSKKVRQAFSDRAPSFLQRSNLSPKDVDFFLGEAEGRASEERNPFHRLLAWDTLERLSIKGLISHDPLVFQPSQVDVRRSRSPVQHRTTTLMPRDLHRLLKLSSTWVLDYSPYILKCLRERKLINPGGNRHSNISSLAELTERMDLERPQGVPALSLALAPVSPFHEGRLLLTHALQYLFVAASMLIGALAGRRRNETGSLRAYPIVMWRGIVYLTVYIEKTLQDVDRVPVPELVVHAVNLLHELSQEAREEAGTEWLFQFKSELADDLPLRISSRLD